jgi:enoyl-CoA hydratase/carnithine racemase
MIQGACVGGGLEIACNCDLRIAGESARFGVPINRLGFAIAYDELAGLLALAGRAVAAEILLEGRVWTADEAFAKGLLTRVVADADVTREAYAIARRIADGAPLVARWHKQFIRRLTVGAPPLTAAEVDANFDYLKTDDYRQGIDAFINKKKPQFKGT